MTDKKNVSISSLEASALSAASKRVAAMLQRPEQLDKVPGLIERVGRKQASVEAMLKSMMNGQLDGVVAGLKQLETAMEEVRDIEESVGRLGTALGEVPDLVSSLEDVRAENCHHSQLSTAMDNLRHIFEVPELVSKTLQWIEDGNLLLAHQSLGDLENSRDDLLYELHRTRTYNSTDRDLLYDYFKDVTELSIRLEKHLMFILLRAFATVRKNPKELVTALRIIDREERIDEECIHKQKQTGFLPPQRPKQWKEKCLAKMREDIDHKIEGNQLETRVQNKMWLVRHLEVIRMVMLEDLRIAKHHLTACFPPSYEIFQHCLSLYHSVVANRLKTIIEDGLEGQEAVSLLQWTEKTWAGQELLGSPALGLNPTDIVPVLESDLVDQVMASHLAKTRDNYSAWMINTIKQEKADWNSEKYPEKDAEDIYHTASPVIVFQMVDETLQVSATISHELVHSVLVLGIEQLVEFGQLYQAAIAEYKSQYFRDRSMFLPDQFTKNMIAIINNCERFQVLSQEMKGRWWKVGHHDIDGMGKFEQLIRTFQDICKLSITFLLDEAFEDIELFFPELITAAWHNDSLAAIQSICITLKDYFGDYKCLKQKNFEEVITEAQDTVARKYITSMLVAASGIRRKITFNGEEDRKEAADKIKSEASHCKSFFKDTAGDIADFDSPFDTIVALTEILASDEEMLFLELGTLCKRYPDISNEQIICLLLLRGDINRGDAKQLASEFVANGVDGEPHKTFHARSVLSQVNVVSSFADKLNPFVSSGKEVAAGLSVLNAFTIGRKEVTATLADRLNPFAAAAKEPATNLVEKLNPFGSSSKQQQHQQQQKQQQQQVLRSVADKLNPFNDDAKENDVTTTGTEKLNPFDDDTNTADSGNPFDETEA